MREITLDELRGALQFSPKYIGGFDFFLRRDGIYRRGPHHSENFVKVRPRDAFQELRLRSAPVEVSEAFLYTGNMVDLAKKLNETGMFRKPRKVAKEIEMDRNFVDREIVAVETELVAAEGDKCGEQGCIRKVGGKWGVMSGKTGKMWPQNFDTKEDAEDSLKRYHGRGFKGSELVAGSRWVKEVMLELKELKKLGINIPRKKFNEREIERFFGPEGASMGSRELSEMIDTYLIM